MSSIEDYNSRHYLSILVEKLYSNIRLVRECTLPDKKIIEKFLIVEFYNNYKEQYGIQSIEEIQEMLAEIQKHLDEKDGESR